MSLPEFREVLAREVVNKRERAELHTIEKWGRLIFEGLSQPVLRAA